MREFKIYLLSLFLLVTFLFNIERLDVGEENVLNIQTFVYVLTIIIIVSTLLIPFFSNYHATVTIATALLMYGIGKWLFLGERPLFSSLQIYVIISEVAFISAIAFMSHRLARSLYAFQEGFEALAVELGGGELQSIAKSNKDIHREITRSRHYHRPLSLIVVEPNQDSMDSFMPAVFEELQKTIHQRFARAKLAKSMKRHLRLMDMILDDDQERFVILCPEADSEGSAVITDRIQAVIAKANIKAKYGTATFPDEALTFNGLLEKAKEKLQKK